MKYGEEASKERLDKRVGGGNYFLSHDEVNAWDEGHWGSIGDIPEGEDAKHLWTEGLCEDRWENMKDRNTAQSVGKFEECGWVVLLCRHMFLLLACDLVRSGEQ